MDYLAPLRSALKAKILASLLEGDKKLGELKTEVASRETTILHAIKEFEALNLTTKSEGTYKLTPLGIMEAQLCKEYYAASKVMENYKDYWLSHDVKAIPENLMLNIGALEDSTLIKADAAELGKVHETFMQVLLSSKKIKGISPIFHQDFVIAIQKILDEGNSAELIINSTVMSKILAAAEKDQIEKHLHQGKLTLYLNENLNLALTVTESSFSLGLFKLDKQYDYTQDIVSLSPKAIKWGEELFQNILLQSIKLGADNLK